MKNTLPEVPTANLNDISVTSSSLLSLGLYSKSHTSKLTNTVFLRDRGYISWYWTFETENDIKDAINNGYTGITTNSVNYFENKVQYIEGKEFTLLENQIISDVDLPLILHYYNGRTEEVIGTIFSYEKESTHYNVIYQYEINLIDEESILLTQTYKINK